MTVRFESFRNAVEGKLVAGIERNLAAAGLEWASEIPKLMSGPKSGKRYPVPGTSRTYQASAPGEAPARQTGALAASYGMEMPNKYTAVVGTEFDYGLELERGNSRIKPRPAIKPAFEKARSRIEALMKRPIE